MNCFKTFCGLFLLLPLLLAGGEIHPNRLLGIRLFPEPPEKLWEESDSAILTRLRICDSAFSAKKKILTSCDLEGLKILGIPASELRLVRDAEENLLKVDIYFYNKGDSARERNMKMKIHRAGQNLERQLTKAFGAGIKIAFGPEKNNASMWKKTQAIWVVEFVKGEFTVLHLLSPKTIKRNSKAAVLPKKDLASNVTHNEFGDYWIKNIPMVNQGNKGYCAPATLERILLYYGCTDLDMHRIADIAATGRGGGTSMVVLQNALIPILRKKGISTVKLGEIIFFTIKKLILKGIPIFWCMYTSKNYEELRRNNTAARMTYDSVKKWKIAMKKHGRISNNGEGHVCLIIGFNEHTKEIAVSNSWGNAELQPSWIPLADAKKVSQHQSWVYLPDYVK